MKIPSKKSFSELLTELTNACFVLVALTSTMFFIATAFKPKPLQLGDRLLLLPPTTLESNRNINNETFRLKVSHMNGDRCVLNTGFLNKNILNIKAEESNHTFSILRIDPDQILLQWNGKQTDDREDCRQNAHVWIQNKDKPLFQRMER